MTPEEKAEARELMKEFREESSIFSTQQLPKISKSTDLTKVVKTIEQVYELLERDMPTIDNYKHVPTYKRERALYSQYIDDISELFNRGWKPNWTNSSEYKYYPYFEFRGSRWVFYDFGSILDCSFLGSGFYYKDQKTSDYCGTQFIDIYSKVLN